MLKTKLLAGIAIAAALSFTASAAFVKTNTYTDGLFTDVPDSEWYTPEVKSTYELSLMNGTGNGLFSPDGNVTVAEAITMASRASSIYAGETIPAAKNGEWYQMYVDYAISKGFVTENQFDSYDRPAKRHEVASLFENAMPDGYFEVKNNVTDIPDVSEKQPYAKDLLTLYNAGIVMGSDAYGNFRPEDNITRAEAAAIINRVALPENRLSKELKKLSGEGAYYLIKNSDYISQKEGINSGWILDNRGGAPRTDLLSSYAVIYDIEDDESVSLIREINKTDTGYITFRTKANFSDLDGAYLEFRNDSDKSVYQLLADGSGWSIRSTDGKYTQIYKAAERELDFSFQIELDLDNGEATTYINNKNCGTFPLTATDDDLNILNFRFATTEESTSAVAPGEVNAFVNFAVNEEFTFTNGNLPFDWAGNAGTAGDGTLTVGHNENASKYFTPVSGKIAADFLFLATNRENLVFSLMSGLKTLIKFESDGTDLYANGTKIYENYVPTVWYAVRAEADTDTQTALIKINGKDAATVPFAQAATSADAIAFSNSTEGTVAIDSVRVYEIIMPEDYVPVPVKPEGEEKYNVGINVCSIWQNGWHHSWSCNSPFDDRLPVLGYYEEGKPETADWEIKYMVEHGIDFQGFCWYAGSSYQPQKPDRQMEHIRDGFMNAEYSDMMKFCIIWEAANAAVPVSVDAYKKYFVPTWIENFFKDPRYMTIDNKAVMLIFGHGNVVNAFGGAAGCKEQLDYLREEVKKLGYEDLIILASHASDSQSLADSGFDGTVAYNWGTSGYDLEHNKSSILKNADSGFTYTVPTISVGFNSISWWGVRYPMMSMQDYKAAHEWVKNEYLPKYAKEDWQKNFVYLSTWNEYGEGTFIMPTADEKGFGYLDILREAYTDEKADESVNTVPTDAQKERITRMYPQYRRLLRKQGYFDESKNNETETVYKVDLSAETVQTAYIEEMEQTSKGLSGISTGDAKFFVSNIDIPDLSEIDFVKITTQYPKGTIMSFFHTTVEDTVWNTEKSINITSTTDEMQSIIINASDLKVWDGKLQSIRLDPVHTTGHKFTVQSIEFISYTNRISKEILINGNAFPLSFKPEFNAAGDIVIAFDPDSGIDFGLDAFHLWDKDKKELTLYFKEHTFVYTVGSDKYLLDGKEMNIGYPLEELDGLPLIPIQQLCDHLGYAYMFADDQITIETHDRHFFEKKASEVPGVWDFNLDSSTGGFEGRKMSIMASNGYLSCNSNSSNADPNVYSPSDLELPAAKYSHIEMKVRYNYNYKENEITPFTIYFITDKDPAWSESKSIKITHNSTDTNGEWEIYTFDTSSNPLWKDTITRVRFDPFTGVGKMDVDYMHLIENPDYIDPDTLPLTLVNPDAEDTSNIAFTSANGTIEIVEDPDDTSNHCYRVISARPGQRNHVYSTQNVRFKPGASYTVELDVRLYAHDQNTELADDFTATILCNAQYKTPGSGNDHVVGRVALKAGDGWGKLKVSFTVNAGSTDRSADVLSFYADPVDSLGIGYYFDNIVITETLPE